MGSDAWESHEPVRLVRCEHGHPVEAGEACKECARETAADEDAERQAEPPEDPRPARDEPIGSSAETSGAVPGSQGEEQATRTVPLPIREPGPDKSSLLKWSPLPIALIVLLAAGAWIYLPNRGLQSAIGSVLADDPRNDGVKVSVHYDNYIDRSTLVYNLEDVAADNSPMDVFRVFLQFAQEMQDEEFGEVRLAFRGDYRFKLDGDYFQELGEEYDFQNPAYTIRTFPENLMEPDGVPAYGEWTGGVLGVLNKQLEDFNDFHRRWYMKDL